MGACMELIVQAMLIVQVLTLLASVAACVVGVRLLMMLKPLSEPESTRYELNNYD